MNEDFMNFQFDSFLPQLQNINVDHSDSPSLPNLPSDNQFNLLNNNNIDPSQFTGMNLDSFSTGEFNHLQLEQLQFSLKNMHSFSNQLNVNMGSLETIGMQISPENVGSLLNSELIGKSGDTDKIELSKPKRVKACERCREKKRKCDGKQPCNNCSNAIARKVESENCCTYNTDTKNRSKRVVNEDLIDRIINLESRLKEKDPNISLQSQTTHQVVDSQECFIGNSLYTLVAAKSKTDETNLRDQKLELNNQEAALNLSSKTRNNELDVELIEYPSIMEKQTSSKRSISDQLKNPVTSLTSPPELVAHLLGLFYDLDHPYIHRIDDQLDRKSFFKNLYPKNTNQNHVILSMCAFSARFSTHPHLYLSPFTSPMNATLYFLKLLQEEMNEVISSVVRISNPSEWILLLGSILCRGELEYGCGTPRFAADMCLSALRILQDLQLFNPDLASSNPFNVFFFQRLEVMQKLDDRMKRVTLLQRRDPAFVEGCQKISSFMFHYDTICSAAGGAAFSADDDEFEYLLERPSRYILNKQTNEINKRRRLPQDSAEMDLESLIMDSVHTYSQKPWSYSTHMCLHSSTPMNSTIESQKAHTLIMFQFRKIYRRTRRLQAMAINRKATPRGVTHPQASMVVLSSLSQTFSNLDIKLHDSTLKMYFGLPFPQVRALESFEIFTSLVTSRTAWKPSIRHEDARKRYIDEEQKCLQWTMQFDSFSSNLWTCASISWLHATKSEQNDLFFMGFQSGLCSDNPQQPGSSEDADFSVLMNSSDVILTVFHASCFIGRQFLSEHGWIDDDGKFREPLCEHLTDPDEIKDWKRKLLLPAPMIYNCYYSFAMYIVTISALSTLQSNNILGVLGALNIISRTRQSTKEEEQKEVIKELEDLVLPSMKMHASKWPVLNIYIDKIIAMM
ncbi:hypothetical protein HK096_002425 [Nowakowskiella sp. JEL0078]|nr:hypothetical protein HK096_002425 [Nowakowskiella sp. JEL0078]